MKDKIYRQFVETTTEALFDVDTKGIIRYVNSAALSMLGHKADEVIGKKIYDFLSASSDGLADREYLSKSFNDSNGNPFCSTCRFITKDNETVDTRASVTSKDEGDGSLLLCTDITEHLSYIKRLQYLNKRLISNSSKAVTGIKNELCRSMGRDIRIPLVQVLEKLKEASNVTSVKKKTTILDSSLDLVEGMLHLVDDILDISEIDSGEVKLNKVKFDLEEFVESTISLLATQTRAKSLDLSFKIARGVPRKVYGDLTQLTQVLVNLVGNAIKFTKDGQIHLHISVDRDSEDGKDILFSISDTGKGISEKRLLTIFEGLGQQYLDEAREKGGTGLGLALCKKLVVLMGGYIWAESSIGKGSIFYFSIPLQSVAGLDSGKDYGKGVAPIVLDESISLVEMRILIIDDNINERDILKTMLQDLGATDLYESSDVIGAVDIILAYEGKFDLILMDCKMPSGNGFDILERVDAEDNEIELCRKVVMMFPPKHRKSDTHRMEQYGLLSSFEKPIGSGRVLKAINKLLVDRPKEIKSGPAVSGPVRIANELLHITIIDDGGDASVEHLLQDGPYVTSRVDCGGDYLAKLENDSFHVLIVDLDFLENSIDSLISDIEKVRKKSGHGPNSILVVKNSYDSGEIEKLKRLGISDFFDKPTKQTILVRSMLKHVFAENEGDMV